MDLNSKIFVAGHRGLVGSAIVRTLAAQGFCNIICRNREELNLLDQAQVREFFLTTRPDFVFQAAAKVGGIGANSTQQADFLYENLVIACNVIGASAEAEVKKLLFLGSSCIYPKMAEQPIREEYLLSGPLEPTNEGYAIAKIAGLKLCEMFHRQYGKNFISAMPTNLYGVGDNFHPENSHVIPGMMRRFHEAKTQGHKTVTIWGSGSPLRNFLHADDLAEALVLLMEKYDQPNFVNVGSCEEISIKDLARMMRHVLAFDGEILFDQPHQTRTPRKIMDISKIQSLGWKPRISLEAGLTEVYKWALQNNVFGEQTTQASCDAEVVVASKS